MSDRTTAMGRIAADIESTADRPMPLPELAHRHGLSPSVLRRRFTESIGVSPHQYQRAVRLDRLREGLRRGDSIAGAIYEAGFGSVSRVYEHADRDLGMTPARYRARGFGLRIDYAIRRTRLGLVIMAATDRGVCRVHFGDSADRLVEELGAEFPNADVRRSAAEGGAELDAWMAALQAHIDEGQPRADLPIHVFGTALQVRTWRFLAGIGDARTISYSEVAEAIGRPRAVRAVARACAANDVAVLVPCHRVLRKDGSPGGYRWGLERKQALLEGIKAPA